mmetsp:Transcript_12021/g.23761  ORF Transcript_12021/g.23761 Transcript_12021/m.23761 type:complete len:288 (-) Transcript_12021:713-1576(-)
MPRPCVSDRLGRPDPRTPRISRGAKPMVLRRSSGPRAEANVRCAVQRAAQNLVLELGIVADNSRREVLVHSLESLKNPVNILGAVLRHHVDRRKELAGALSESLLRSHHALKRHEDSGRHHITIHRRDRVVTAVDGDPPPQQLRPGDGEEAGDVRLPVLRPDAQRGPDGQVLEVPGALQLVELLNKALLRPVVVHEKDAHRTALLPAARVCVLVALAHLHIKKRSVGHVRTENLPVEPPPLDLDLAVKRLGQPLSDLSAARKLRHPRLALNQKALKHRPSARHQVHV